MSSLAAKRRFPEFMGQPLHHVRLRDLTEESTARNEKQLSLETVMGVKKGDGIVPMEKRLVASDISRYKLVRKNWFAYNPMRLNIGSIARWQGDGDVLVSPDYVVFHCLERSMPTALLPEYLDSFRSSWQWDAFVNDAGDGGVRVRIYYRDIAKLHLVLPDVEEQRKIADCLGSLDDLIAAESRMLETLRRHKQGLMQQLFPQPSATVPRLRFSEFRDWPEWDLLALSSACEINPRNDGLPDRFIYIDLESVKNNLLIDRKEIARDAAPSRAQRLLSSKDIIYQTVRPYQRNNLLFDVYDGNEYVASTGYAQLRTRECPEFLHQLIHTDSFVNNVLARCAGSNYPAIKPSDLASIEVALPPKTQEQQKIAECLGSLDDLIAAKGRKLDALRHHKQGLMQQLFPSLEAVSR